MADPNLDRDEYVEESLIEAEHAIEDALVACDNEDERGQLIGILDGIHATEYRFHDEGFSEAPDSSINEEGAGSADD